ncbi:hypothetical protein PHAVU_006G212600 [Phaseolus vulgaris]|uniref:XS domain-containing protein n=1 Tax=Phaseolus vulgaris TaxID=3885 RepID=V7BTW8_PHAVU|nr:hypothetical protein PHAVU_006G212600g [Phaseolus vulgaris]ESW20478.1 hypothetical protein PHAVU_006G212600g [Phaseolus vulgaris]
MAEDGADPFPQLRSVYRVSAPQSNLLNSRWLHPISDGSASRPWFSQNSAPNAWGNPNGIQKLKLVKRKNNSLGTLACIGSETLNNSNLPPQSVLTPVLEKELNSSIGVDPTTSKDCKNDQCKSAKFLEHGENNDEIVEDKSDIVSDSDDNCSLDDIDSDTGERSHEQCKKSKWLRNFFDRLNALANEEISSQDRQWHCPACQGMPGAIDWYNGLQPLLDHSRTIQSKRVRVHRMFAETLEEECLRRRVPLTVVCEIHDRWEVLDKKVKDHEIVWPPMVIIMNTRYQQDENNKWNGMGNQELLDCFRDYAAFKARHSYGPQGHRGLSVLIFEESTAGYLEAVRLHKHFKEQRRDREAWNSCQNPFIAGGKRQLYGYLASKEDLNDFNRHSRGKPHLKFEMRSYQEMVESKIKHISDDSRKLNYYKSMIVEEQSKSQICLDSFCELSEKLSLTTEENLVGRQNKEMDSEEKNFQDQIKVIQQVVAAKEIQFVKLQQAMQEKAKNTCQESFKKEDNSQKSQDKEIMQLESEREKIMKIHEEKKLALKKKQRQEMVELEKELENELTQLMDKYTSNQSQGNNLSQINGC